MTKVPRPLTPGPAPRTPPTLDDVDLATYLSARGAEEVTARLNALYGVQPSEIEPAIQRAQLSSTSRR